MKNTWFVAGTDTEVGKTFTACALLLAAARIGLRTAALKPVAAGCDEHGRNEDAMALARCMTAPLSYAEVNPVALQDAIAPHLAAAREGREPRVAELARHCRDTLAASDADFMLVEGAGGWRVPLNTDETLADLARVLELDVILVVGMRLGCINHALLTAEAIARDGLRLAGWVANQPGERMACHNENVATLRRLLPAPLLGELPWIPGGDVDAAGKHIEIQLLKGM